jgi:hypothetical protein
MHHSLLQGHPTLHHYAAEHMAFQTRADTLLCCPLLRVLQVWWLVALV